MCAVNLPEITKVCSFSQIHWNKTPCNVPPKMSFWDKFQTLYNGLKVSSWYQFCLSFLRHFLLVSLDSVFKQHRTISSSKHWPLSPKRFSFAEILCLFGVFGTLFRCRPFCNDFPDIPQACSLSTLELLIYMLFQNRIYAFTVTLPSICLSLSFTPVYELLEGIFKFSVFYSFGPWQGLLKE